MTSDRVTISWTLLILSVAHCVFWSVGVCEESSQDYFARQTTFVGECRIPERFSIEERLLYLQEKLLEDRRLSDQKRERVKRVKPLKLPNLTSTSAQEQTLSVFLPTSNEDPSYQ
jgi:hypothetical protein